MLSFDVKLTDETLNASVVAICKVLKPQWSKFLDKITIKRLNGGITNCLYVCHLIENSWNHCDSILFRIYGLNTEEFISRSEEMSTMTLMNQIGLGPKIYAKFNNGICYELLAGEILTTQDVQNREIFIKVKLISFKKVRIYSKFEIFQRFGGVNQGRRVGLFMEN